ncbi:MAG: hypothetical protein KF883_15900 [Thermomicrobiales bacterium]|nr:hypothetical protein [Thermomicrobiales bacterium]
MRRNIFIALAILASIVVSQQATAQQSTPTADQCQTGLLVPTPDFPAVPTVAAPAASPGATPEAAAPRAAIPATNDVTAEVDALARSLAACISSGNAVAVGELTTAEYRGDLYGGGERLSLEDYLAIVSSAPLVETQVISVSNATFDGMLTVSADVQLIRGHQLFHERWTFLFREVSGDTGTPVADGQGVWRAHRIQPLPVDEPGDVSRVGVRLDEYRIRLDKVSVNGPNIMLTGRNDGDEAHEMLVIQLAPSAKVEDLLLPSSGFPAGIAIIGELTLLPGETGELILVDLEPGRYVIACLLPDEDGIPHLSFGQKATLDVK